MPDIVPVEARVFAGFIQTPHRFKTQAEALKYTLGIVDRRSAAKPLAY